LATLSVYLGHFPFSKRFADFTAAINIGYDAVVIFFVLSGYLISYAAAEIEKTWEHYVVARLARIYPVALASILLALFLQYAAHGLSNGLYFHEDHLRHIPYICFVSASFLNEIWWLDVRPFDNGPYWTLSFEVWDYVFYGVLIFTKGRTRVFWSLAILAITGPKFWLLLPVWLLGSAAYRWRNCFTLHRAFAGCLFTVPLVAYCAIKHALPAEWSYSLAGQPLETLLGGHGLDGAANFLWAYILGSLCAVHLWAARQFDVLQFLKWRVLAKPAKWLAGYSYSLYIYHFPICLFLLSFFRIDFEAPTLRARIPLYIASLSIVYVLATYTEHKKGFVRSVLSRWLAARLAARRGRVARPSSYPPTGNLQGL
jgi:peptidoglycan/LPS O-acetylase OafA/YrhL